MNLIIHCIRNGTRLFLFLPMFLFGSCGEIINGDDYNIKQLDASPTMALPLAHGSLTIQDFLNKDDSANIKIDVNDVVYYQYDQALKSHEIRSLFVLSDKSTSESIPLPVGPIPPNSNEEILESPFPIVLDFNFTPQKLKEILFKEGFINLNQSDTKYEVEVSLPDFTLDNLPFKKRIGNGPVLFSLDGYKAILNDNKFDVIITVIVKPHNTILTPAPTLNVDISFTNMDFKYIKGFLGDQIIELPEQFLALTVFNTSFKDRDVTIEGPLIEFKMDNDYGIPLKVNFTTAEGRKGNSNIPMILNPSNPITITPSPVLGSSAVTSIQVENDQQVIDLAPTKLYYKLNAHINDGLTTGNNFCADTSQLRVKLHVELPLFGRAADIIMTDTIDIDLSDVKASEVESFFLKIKTTNQLPVDATLQLYLADDKGVIIDSLFSTNQTEIIKASKVNSAGELESTSVNNQQIDVPKNKIDPLFKAKKLIINAAINTLKNSNNTQPDVRFKSKYKMDVIIGLNAKLKLKVNL